MRVNMHEAKSTLSKLAAAAEDHQQETILCRGGRPVAKITPLASKSVCAERKSGLLRDQIIVLDHFDDFLASDAAVFGINVP